MKKTLIAMAVLALAASPLVAWQFGTGSGDHGTLAPLPPKKAPTKRSLTGVVHDQKDTPLGHAVVYLKDTRTANVKTYIANADGTYQFNGLSPNQDYELYAEFDGRKSSTKTLSAFDSREKANINLRVETKAR